MKIHKSQGFGVPQVRFVSWSSRITWPCWTSWKARHQGRTPWCQATGVGRAHCWIDMSVGLHPPYLLILLRETSICYAFYLRLTYSARGCSVSIGYPARYLAARLGALHPHRWQHCHGAAQPVPPGDQNTLPVCLDMVRWFSRWNMYIYISKHYLNYRVFN